MTVGEERRMAVHGPVRKRGHTTATAPFVTSFVHAAPLYCRIRVVRPGLRPLSGEAAVWRRGRCVRRREERAGDLAARVRLNELPPSHP
ncbi:hypothetical protein DFJ64_0187 [Thermasporomyces composti]|jgi:hypothetical protein|uniref:Uncharacterized protein n=1 Tax=Thermasporomyces composti TaxID=696763 RepID=A0A3D9VC05_THECX|nr:hypothetical protein DFJ64_0187 [Thermasporomyces composti]